MVLEYCVCSVPFRHNLLLAAWFVRFPYMPNDATYSCPWIAQLISDMAQVSALDGHQWICDHLSSPIDFFLDNECRDNMALLNIKALGQVSQFNCIPPPGMAFHADSPNLPTQLEPLYVCLELDSKGKTCCKRTYFYTNSNR